VERVVAANSSIIEYICADLARISKDILVLGEDTLVEHPHLNDVEIWELWKSIKGDKKGCVQDSMSEIEGLPTEVNSEDHDGEIADSFQPSNLWRHRSPIKSLLNNDSNDSEVDTSSQLNPSRVPPQRVSDVIVKVVTFAVLSISILNWKNIITPVPMKVLSTQKRYNIAVKGCFLRDCVSEQRCIVCGFKYHGWVSCDRRYFCMTNSKQPCYLPEFRRLHYCLCCHRAHPGFQDCELMVLREGDDYHPRNYCVNWNCSRNCRSKRCKFLHACLLCGSQSHANDSMKFAPTCTDS
jgi:hypothetical protein